MTVSSATSAQTFLGNGATTVFTFGFVGVSTNYLTVTYVDASGDSSNVTSQCSIALNSASGGALWGVGGAVTYSPPAGPIASGTSLTVARVMPLTQLVQISTQANLYLSAFEQALDTQAMGLQQVAAEVTRSILAPVSDIGPSLVLPPSAARANQFLSFDAYGNVQLGIPPFDLTNGTGLPLTTGVTGVLPVANGGTGVTLVTGSGKAVLSTSPTIDGAILNSATLTTPSLGTPSSGYLTNTTGLPLTSGVTGTLPASNGGTGIATAPTAGALLYGTGTAYALSPVGLAGQVLMSGGSGTPYWGTVTGTGTVTSVQGSGGTTGLSIGGGPITVAGTLTLSGVLNVANGGTGDTTLPVNNVLIGNGTSPVTAIAPGASGNLLTSNGTVWTSSTPAAQQWQAGTVTSLSGLSVSGGVLSALPAPGTVGAPAMAQYSGASTPVIGTTYPGSTLLDMVSGSSLGYSGLWRCITRTRGYSPPVNCCFAVAAQALFERVS